MSDHLSPLTYALALSPIADVSSSLRLNSGVHHTTSSSPPHENGLESYTYTTHIPRVGNTQRLLDSRNKVRVDTSFVNLNDGKDWGARVEMK